MYTITSHIRDRISTCKRSHEAGKRLLYQLVQERKKDNGVCGQSKVIAGVRNKSFLKERKRKNKHTAGEGKKGK